MESQDTSIPGITLKLIDQQISTSEATGRKRGRLTIEVDIINDAIWEAVEKKLSDGYRIPAVDGFAAEVVRVLRADNDKLEQECHSLRCNQSHYRTRIADLESSLKALIDREQKAT